MKKILTRSTIVLGLLFIANISLAAIWDAVGCSGVDCQTCHLVSLSNEVINFLLFYVAMPFAALVFAYAGFMLIFAKGNESKISQAKAIFGYVFWGLIIALAAFLVIDSILKSLLTGAQYGVWNNVQCVAQPTYSSATGPAPTGTPPPGPGPTSTGVPTTPPYSTVTAAGINIWSSGSCYDAAYSNCTSLDGMDPVTVNQALWIKSSCPTCVVTITGGTETGHAPGACSHGSGDKIDIDDNVALDSYISTNCVADGARGGAYGGPRYKCTDSSGNDIEWVRESTHWDISTCYYP